MTEADYVQRQLTQLAVALASGALLIIALLAFNSYREQAAQRVMYDYHLASEASARALYAADARMRHPLGLHEVQHGEVEDLYTYVSNILLEYEIIRKQAARILVLDREYANPLTASVVGQLEEALDELNRLLANNTGDQLANALLIAQNELDIGLLAEQLFRIHHSAFLARQNEYVRQQRLQSIGLLVLVAGITGLGAVFWVKSRKTIGDSLVRESEAVRASVLAEQSNIAKSDFLSRMSHELRTPLHAILGFGEVLKRNLTRAGSGEQVQQVDEIINAGKHLLDLVNDVLDLNLIEHGKLRVQLQPVEIAASLDECLAQLKAPIEERAISVTVEVPESHRVQADPTRLRQVLLNLLSNAVKYNREGGAIQVESEAVSEEHYRVIVRDTGPGITAESIPRLFNTFERIETQAHAVEGAGIGLALTKQLVTIMHGEIGVDSLPGQGSTFWFELPVAAA